MRGCIGGEGGGGLGGKTDWWVDMEGVIRVVGEERERGGKDERMDGGERLPLRVVDLVGGRAEGARERNEGVEERVERVEGWAEEVGGEG